jgi:tRNA1Val (adenine37-N6)-methyltransferase
MRFKFKKFGLNHGVSAMKIGFDSVLLGGWAKIKAGQSVLDIGAGCGILGLMLSQKAAQLHITFLEKDERAAHECQQNIHQMPWEINHSVVAQDFQNFSSQSEEKFDVVISNPPYFQPNGQIEGVERE